MTKKEFVALATYNNWTDTLIMDWLNQINDQQWNQPIESSFNSIRKTVIHMVSAKKIWIDFWTKAPEPVYLSAGFTGTKAELIEIWQQVSNDLIPFIANCSEEDFLKPVDFVYPNGKQGQMIFWQTFLHFVNHATYHRGQLVTLLRQAGFTTFSNTDLVTYLLKNDPAKH